MKLKKIVKIFESGNVSVDGLRGCGKDMLIANVINYRNRPYISNVDYKCKNANSVYIRLDFDKLDVLNNYKQLIKDDIIPYDYPYPEKCDIYLSDAGVYFPSQYCSELNKQFANMPVFQALSRQLGECNFHTNTQNLNRVWDKIREQSDIYIKCNWCKVLFKNIVFQKITLYDKYESCLNRVEPYKHVRIPILSNKEQRALMRTKDEELYRNFKEKNGSVKVRYLIYKNKTKYDTRLFKKILGGKK